jgi:hypothetical protein
MIAIITIAMPILIKILGMIIEKYFDNKEAKEQFIKLVSALELGGMRSVNLHNSYRDQIDKYKKDVGGSKSTVQM